MHKNIWQKISQNHLLWIVICCLISVILIISFLALYNGSNNYWVWLIILLCPLSHILMMRWHKHSNACKKESDREPPQEEVLYKCPECGFKYKEKEWAEKCARWCKKHKTCNLEITKQAINR